MEIHKPKAWHNWRELAKEVGVIVIGIAIALGGEQCVEWLHRHAEVAEARKALKSEITANLRIARYSIAEDRCFQGLLDRSIAWAKGGPHGPTGIAGRIPDLATSTWDVVKVGAAAHMPLEERLAFSRIYDTTQQMQWAIGAERAAFLKLFGYTTMESLPPDDARRLMSEVAQTRVLALARSGGAEGLIQSARAIGLEPPAISPKGQAALAQLCALSQEPAQPAR